MDVTFCSIECCGRQAETRGWCGRHYMRWQRHGDPLGGRPSYYGDKLDWLLANYLAPQDGPCVLWPFPPTAWGYGYVTVDGVRERAHRYALVLREGPPPDGKPLAIHGPCHQTLCIIHARWGSHKDNSADQRRDGTINCGPRKGQIRLSVGDVWAVRRLRAAGLTQCAIAEKVGVGQTTISAILRGRTWSWLDEESAA